MNSGAPKDLGQSELSGSEPEEEKSRAGLYGLLSVLLARPPAPETMRLVAEIKGSETEMGRAVNGLALRAANADAAAVKREFHELFVGLGRGELLPYGSYYLTGFLHEKPLAKLRNELSSLGITRAESVREPEDHISSLCEAMQGLILGSFGSPLGIEHQKAFFETHISPWAGHFFSDLETAHNADFYAPVGAVGRTFVEIESEAFRMVA